MAGGEPSAGVHERTLGPLAPEAKTSPRRAPGVTVDTPRWARDDRDGRHLRWALLLSSRDSPAAYAAIGATSEAQCGAGSGTTSCRCSWC